ncbi:MAG: EDR1-related protein [Bdellovibrionales bacterium]
MSGNPFQQALDFNRNHRIGESERLLPGYRDGGRHIKFSPDGKPNGRPNREFILFKHPRDDPPLKRAIDHARSATANMGTVWEKTIFVAQYVADLMKENDPDQNEVIMDRISGKGSHIGAEISLGQLIQAGTGVCRHRSLLFKVIADELGIPTALVRGNYIDQRGSSEHAWNEIVLDNGNRAVVDVMHNFVGNVQHPKVRNYADVRGNFLYRNYNISPAQTPLPEDINWVRHANWVGANSPSGGRCAYVYLDALNQRQEAALRQALAIQGIKFDTYQTSFGANAGQRREVIRVQASEIQKLTDRGSSLSHPVPAATSAQTISEASWVAVDSPSGGKCAYIYLDAMSRSEQNELRRALKLQGISCDDYQTSFGSFGGQRRSVLRIIEPEIQKLRLMGARIDNEVPPYRPLPPVPESPRNEKR